MKNIRLKASALFLAFAIIFAASCAETPAPLAPEVTQVAPNNDQLLELLRRPLNSLNLMTCRALPADTESAIIGPNGGTIRVGPHRLEIPRGALRVNTRITASIESERVNHVELQPHGLEFRKPVELTMSYANCDLVSILLPKTIVYTTPRLRILDVLETVDDLRRRELSTELDHFSDYVLAW